MNRYLHSFAYIYKSDKISSTSYHHDVHYHLGCS